MRYVSLTGDDALKSVIVSATARSPHVFVETSPEGFQNDKTRQLKISLVPDLPVGRFREQVTVATDHPVTKQITVYLYGEVLGNIAVSPAYISFGTLEPGSAAERTVSVTATGDNTFAVLEVNAAEPEIQSTVETIQEGKEYKVLVRVSEQMRKPFVRGTLKIKTDDKDQEIIEVRYFGKARTTPAASSQPAAAPHAGES